MNIRDPWLSPNGAMISILDQPIDVDRFGERIRHAVAEILDFVSVVPGFGRVAPPCGRPTPSSTSTTTSVTLRGPVPISSTTSPPAGTRTYDRTRPLWMFIIVDGLEGGRGALFSKMHHSITDGVGALRLSEKYMDLTRDAEFAVEVDLDAVIADAIAAEEAADRSADGVSPAENLRRSLGHVARRQVGRARRALGEVSTWTGDPLLPRLRRGTTQPAAGSARATRWRRNVAPGSPLWTDRSRQRHLETISLSVSAMKSAGKALDASINDLFVTGIALGASTTTGRTASRRMD